MRSKDILRAMDLLDQDLVDEAKKPEKNAWVFRKMVLLVAAVMLLGALGISAIAAAEGSGWFLEFFSRRSGTALSEGQIYYIENSTVNMVQSQTLNGYTLTMESAFTDGRQSFFQFLLTVPEGTALDADWYGVDWHEASRGSCIRSEEGEDFVVGVGLTMGGMGWRHFPVPGEENKLVLIYETESFSREISRNLADTIWTVRIDGLSCGYRDDELGYRYESLTDGVWTFQIRFPQDCQRQIEFVHEPVKVLAALGVGARFDPEEGILSFNEEASCVTLTSFNLRALTAELSFRYEERDSINGDFGDIYAVMKDGEKVLLIPLGGAPNYLTYRFESPIVLDDVDYILLRDGTILRP